MMDDPVGLPNVYVLIAAAFTVGPLLGVVFTAAVTYMLGRRREVAAEKTAEIVAGNVKLATVEEAAKVKQIALEEAAKIKTALEVESEKQSHAALTEAAKVKAALEIEGEKQHGMLEEIRRLLSGCHEEALAQQREAMALIVELKGEVAGLRSALTPNPGPVKEG